jgi:hypothetical protein
MAKPKRKSDWGRFHGEPLFRWSDDGNSMILMNNLSYEDQKGKVWLAPSGTWTDGASIPRAFWTMVGSPFNGEYRLPAVIHDVYCVSRSEPSKDVHWMFYLACRAVNVPEWRAKLLYYAVEWFGPEWTSKGVLNVSLEPTQLDVALAGDYVRQLEGVEAKELVKMNPDTLRQLHATRERNFIQEIKRAND